MFIDSSRVSSKSGITIFGIGEQCAIGVIYYWCFMSVVRDIMMTTSLWRIDDGARQTPTVDMDKVKILVVGEPATGKSAFVQVLSMFLLLHCSVLDLMWHLYKCSFVDCWCIGGSVHTFILCWHATRERLFC